MNLSGWQDKFHSWILRLRDTGRRMPFAVRIGLALVFFVLGILGLFLPILQGGLFLFIALWLLFPEHSERWLEKLKARFRKKEPAQPTNQETTS